MTLAVSGMSVSGAGSLGCQPGPVHDLLALAGIHDARPDRDDVHPGESADVGLDVALDLGAQRATGHGEGHLHLDHAPLPDADGGDHPQLDDVGTQLGIDDPAQRGAHALLGRYRAFQGPRST